MNSREGLIPLDDDHARHAADSRPLHAKRASGRVSIHYIKKNPARLYGRWLKSAANFGKMAWLRLSRARWEPGPRSRRRRSSTARNREAGRRRGRGNDPGRIVASRGACPAGRPRGHRSLTASHRDAGDQNHGHDGSDRSISPISSSSMTTGIRPRAWPLAEASSATMSTIALDGYQAIEIAHRQRPRYVLLESACPAWTAIRSPPGSVRSWTGRSSSSPSRVTAGRRTAAGRWRPGSTISSSSPSTRTP